MSGQNLTDLLTEVRACTVCAENLPAGPRPIVQVGRAAGIVIIGQAPGRRVHESGTPWQDPSGDRLREWLGLTVEEFYDPQRVAIVPMGFCYPGSAKSGDKPPRPECAPLWHERLLAMLPADRLEIIIGTYAQKRYIENRAPNLTETVASWENYLPNQVVLPHPSPRNAHWLTRNPWFESETLPSVRSRIDEVLDRRG
ncbi:MAG: uracil-DNA glycosylase family protein [Acidimicrobiales bacterium]